MLLEKIIERRNNNPEKIVLLQNEKQINSKDFISDIINTASYLEKIGIKAGDFIAILSSNTLEFIINIFALWVLNAVPVLLNPKLTKDEIKESIKFAGCKFLIGRSEDRKICIENIRFISSFTQNYYEEKAYNFTTNLNDTAVIIFTSGSAGKAKGVVLTFHNLVQSALTGNRILNQNENDRWIASLPFYHVGGFSIIIRAFLFGTSLIIPPSLKNDDLIFSFDNYKPTLASLVSTQLLRILNSDFSPPDSLKYVLLGGGFTDTEIISSALSRGWKIIKVYGSTETSSFVTAVDCSSSFKIFSAGKALYPNEVFIINENGDKLAAKNLGEIVVKSPAVMKEYLFNTEETEKILKKGLYFSGDIGYLDDDGYLYVETRRNDLIISGGENINPQEVESVILKYPGIEEACVVGIEDKEWGHAVAAALIFKKNAIINIDNLRVFLKEKLPGFKIPKMYYTFDEFPKTSLGKIQKEKVKENIINIIKKNYEI